MGLGPDWGPAKARYKEEALSEHVQKGLRKGDFPHHLAFEPVSF